MTPINITTPKIKLSVPLKPEALPPVPMEGPIGDLTLQLTLEGGDWSLTARLNGKSYRRMLKQVREHGAENVAVILQGELRAPEEGGPPTLENAGFQVVPKTPRPT